MTKRIDEQSVKQGRILKVENTERKTKAANATYNAVWVEDADGGNERCILFTDHELKVASDRAKRNPEDLTEKSWWTNWQD